MKAKGGEFEVEVELSYLTPHACNTNNTMWTHIFPCSACDTGLFTREYGVGSGSYLYKWIFLCYTISIYFILS